MTQIREYCFGFNCGISNVGSWDHYHRHNEVEITFVDSGYFTLDIQGNTIDVDPGKLLIFWGGIPHLINSYNSNQNQYWMCVPVSFFFQWIDNPVLFRNIFTSGLILSDINKHLNAYSFLFPLWSEELNNTSTSIREAAQLSICAQIRCTLEDTGRYLSSDGIEIATKIHYLSSKAEKQLFQRVCEYIITNYTDYNLDVDMIAHFVKAHPKYIISLFKRKYGMSINDFILFLRVSEAQKMLLYTEKRVTDIAMDCGFSTVSNFYVAFRKIVGRKPLHLRPRKQLPVKM